MEKDKTCVANKLNEVQLINCCIKSNKLVQLFESFISSTSLKKIEIRGMKSSIKSNVVVAIAELALSLKRSYGYNINNGK